MKASTYYAELISSLKFRKIASFCVNHIIQQLILSDFQNQGVTYKTDRLTDRQADRHRQTDRHFDGCVGPHPHGMHVLHVEQRTHKQHYI